jgi:hypothetical protein
MRLQDSGSIRTNRLGNSDQTATQADSFRQEAFRSPKNTPNIVQIDMFGVCPILRAIWRNVFVALFTATRNASITVETVA